MDSKFEDQSKKIEYPLKAIPLATAAIWTQNWRERKKIEDIRGYFIPMEDINEARVEIGIDNMRGYLGIDDKGENHLLLVGVDAKGNDMIDEENGQFVYDYTKPCPQQCGNGNVLNGEGN
ncbi:hypothetical protein [Kordia jejudonensis]|uniref:hypothetical protein n=1 Tax=Kordia jejudonensis TaxID=1348245 RepID=UPI00062960D7|nr:hypothetical protein [Kordia jejudonensis]